MITKINTQIDHVMNIIYTTEYYNDGKIKIYKYPFNTYKFNTAYLTSYNLNKTQ